MIIGILGGTGKEGGGFGGAPRPRRARHCHRVRDEARAVEKSAELARLGGGDVKGATNLDAALAGAIVIAAVPFAGHRALLGELRPALAGKVLVDTGRSARFQGPPALRAARRRLGRRGGAGRARPDTHVVAALHQIAAHELSALDHAIEADGLFCGDDPAAKASVAELIRALGIRPVDAGPCAMPPSSKR